MPKTKIQCEMIREATKRKILNEAIKYFSINGFDGFKISSFSKQLGIGQGTMYRYYESKEELFIEVMKVADNSKDIESLKKLSMLLLPPKMKIRKLCESIIDSFNDINFAYKITLNTQLLLKENKMLDSDLYKYTAKIFKEGIKAKVVNDEDPIKLSQIFWSNVYVYALTIIFSKDYMKLNENDLCRFILK